MCVCMHMHTDAVPRTVETRGQLTELILPCYHVYPGAQTQVLLNVFVCCSRLAGLESVLEVVFDRVSHFITHCDDPPR